MTQNISLDQIIEAEGCVSQSDLHSKEGVLKRGLEYASENNAVYLSAGDFVGDYQFMELLQQKEIKTKNQMFEDFAYEKAVDSNYAFFDEVDLNSLYVAQIYQTRGIESLLQAFPEERKNDEREKIEATIEYCQTQEFNDKITQLSSKFLEEKKDDIVDSLVQSRAMYFALMETEAEKFANVLNEYSQVPVVMIPGNHENAYFIETVKTKLENPDQLYDLNKQNIGIQQKNGEIISIAGMTNCFQSMPYLDSIFHAEEIAQLYSHMGVSDESLIVQEKVSSKVGDIYPYAQDERYQRITESKGDDSVPLDIFLSHGQIGHPQTKSQNAYSVPYLASAAKLSEDAQLTIEGHIHSEYEGENQFGDSMIRPTGERAAHIRKENGEIKILNWEKTDENFDGNLNNPIDAQTLELYYQAYKKRLEEAHYQQISK